MTPPAPQAAAPARLPASQNTKAARLMAAALQLLSSLERGIPLDAHLLREAMTAAFAASDQHGAWLWKDAYEASEAAAVLFLRKYGPGILKKAGGSARALAMIGKLAALLPSHTRRSEESDQFQQFSTPPGLGFLMTLAAQLTPGELLLEPSAGTGLLAIHAEIAGAGLALNELAETRHGLLSGLFPQAPVTPFNAEQIDDYLDAAIRPTTVLMNPPFSASPGIERTHARRDRAAHPFRLAPPAGRRTACGSDRSEPRSGRGGDRRALCRSFGAGVLCVHRERRRPHLCPPRHEHRYAPHRHRPDSGAGPACPGRSRRQPRRPARADRGEASAAAALFLPSGHPRNGPAIRRRHVGTAATANPFSPSGPFACHAGRGRSPL